jgi:hypothetical protein
MAQQATKKCPDLVSFEDSQWCVADVRTVGGKRYLRIEPLVGRGSRIVAEDEVRVIK